MECGRNGNSANKNVDVLMGRKDEKTTAAGRRKGEKGRLAKREERGIVWEMRRLKGQSRERTWTVRVREQLACEGETGSQAQVSSAGGEGRERSLWSRLLQGSQPSRAFVANASRCPIKAQARSLSTFGDTL